MSRLPFILAIAGLLLVSPDLALAERGPGKTVRPSAKRPTGKVQKRVKYRQMRPRAKKLSFETPKVHKPGVRIDTWGTKTTTQVNVPKPPPPRINRDPWRIQATGYNHGTKGTVKKQIRSKDVNLPKIEKTKVTGKNRKALKKQWSKAMRKSVNEAGQWRNIGNFKVNTDAPGQTYSKVEKDVLPAHTPMKIQAKTIFNQRYATVNTNAQGLPATREKVENVKVKRGSQTFNGQKTTMASGEYLPGFNMKQNVNTKNVFVSTALSKTKTTMTVDLLRVKHGLADGHSTFRFNPTLVSQYRNFQRGAAHNVRGQTQPLKQQNVALTQQIAQLKASKPKLSKADRLQISSWNGQISGNRAQIKSLVNAEFQRAYGNQGVVQQFNAYNNELKALRKNSKMGQQKTTTSTLRVLGLAAFPAGSNVKVTNLRTGESVARKASNSGSGAVEITGMQADRLKVEVSFPNQGTAQGASHSFVVQSPKASGSRSIKRRGVTYHQANVE